MGLTRSEKTVPRKRPCAPKFAKRFKMLVLQQETTQTLAQKMGIMNLRFVKHRILWSILVCLLYVGAGIENQATLKDEVKKRCLYYYELQDIMQDRAPTRPVMTKDAVLLESDNPTPQTDADPPVTNRQAVTPHKQTISDDWDSFQADHIPFNPMNGGSTRTAKKFSLQISTTGN
jgi:hypothetical protein